MKNESIPDRHFLNRKYLILIITILIIALAVLAYSYTQSIAPRGTPIRLYDYKISVLNPQVTEVSGYNGFFNNISQGLSLEVNMTFTSRTDQPTILPVENISISYYNSTVNLHSWINDNGDYSSIQQQAFNYSLSLNQVTLKPYMSNSTLLTINLAQNAPIGQYSIEINLGKVEVMDAIPYAQTIGLELIITPRPT
jgi:hypothetical protein